MRSALERYDDIDLSFANSREANFLKVRPSQRLPLWRICAGCTVKGVGRACVSPDLANIVAMLWLPEKVRAEAQLQTMWCRSFAWLRYMLMHVQCTAGSPIIHRRSVGHCMSKLAPFPSSRILIHLSHHLLTLSFAVSCLFVRMLCIDHIKPSASFLQQHGPQLPGL